MLLITKVNIRQWGEGHQVGNNLLFVRFAITISHASYIFYKLYRISYLFKVQYYTINTLYFYSIYFLTNGRLLHVMFMENFFINSSLLPAYPGRCHIIMLLLVNQEKCILLLITMSNCIYFRGLRTKTLEDWVRDRMIRKRRRPAVEEDRILISQRSEIKWGENRALDKFKIVKAITRDESTYKPGWSDDAKCMRSFLANLDPSSLQDPEITPWLDFILENSPLVDYLVVHSEENKDTWKLPTLSLLKKLQDTRTLSYDLVSQCEV